MAGQGRPYNSIPSPLVSCIRLAMGSAAVAFALVTHADAAEWDVRLRLAWGGESKSWQGTITLNGGEIISAEPIGLEADTPGSFAVENETVLRVLPRSARSYDGCDLHLKTDERGSLRIDLGSGEGGTRVLDVPVAKVLKGLQSFTLDDRGNRLLAQRSPGDALRVDFDRSSLVFAPREAAAFRVTPNVAELAPNSSFTLTMTVAQGRTETEVTSQTREFKTDAQGVVAAENFDLETPAAEGVYDVRFLVTPKRTASSLAPSLIRAKPLLDRRVQFIVIAGELPRSAGAGVWQSEMEIDPATPRWWERLTRVPSLKMLPSFASGPVGNARPGTKSHLGRTLVELAPKNWQAYPLSVTRPGEPHLLEIEYPSDLRQTLGISLIEPNAAGQVVPLGLDSGVDVGEPSAGHVPKMERHRLIIWPQTKAPLVLLVNRREDAPAVYGRIRLLAGPTELEAPAIKEPAGEKRAFIAYFDKPLVVEAFSADEALDPITKRNLDDWLTFYRGGKRMVEYLRNAGYSAAVVPAICEGSTLYPSRLLQPTPNYDSGLYFETGQDPVRKDVLELLLRLHERAGLQLIPAIQFTSPLPELEALRSQPGSATGIEPLGVDGRSWVARNGTRRGQGAYYNPLDSRVQGEMRRVVLELIDRYARHPAFGGLALNLGPESFLTLPDDASGCDDVTLERFMKATGERIPLTPAERASYFRGSARSAWLSWRAEQITQFIAVLEADLQQRRPGAKLILTGADYFSDRALQQKIRPTLLADAAAESPFLSFGLDLEALARLKHVVVPRPQRTAVLASTGMNPLLAQWNRSTDLDSQFSSSAVFHFHEPSPLKLPSFDELSPFGRDKTHTLFVAQISPAGSATRERFSHSLASNDCRTLLDGGWMPIMGQEESLRPWVEVFRQLPAENFRSHEPGGGMKPGSPVVVRSLVQGNTTWFYAVNNSPWATRLEVDLRTSPGAKWEPLSTARPVTIQAGPAGLKAAVSLEPYDLIGGRIVGGQATVEAWRTAPTNDVDNWLRDRIRETRLRANSLRNPQPLTVLKNAGFETPPAADGTVPQWVHAAGPGIRVETETLQPHQGNRSLHLVSSAPPGGRAPVVWLRSESIETPRTGRLSLAARIRVDDPSKQPTLRLAVEGRWDGQPYYRRANVGAPENNVAVKPLTRNWDVIRFLLKDLPLNGLTDLRVGFDLMGEGDVWIDDVQVYDLWFENPERDELLKMIATAELQLDGGRHADCLKFLQSPWPIFLRQFVDIDPNRIAALPPGVNRPPAPIGETPPAEEKNMLNRVRDSLPKWPFR